MAIATSHRIAQVIVRCLDLPSPPCTLSELGRGGCAAPSTIQMWCQTVGLQARDVVAFARGLWVIRWSLTLDAAPNDLLQFAEKRTLRHYLQRSGPLGDCTSAISVEDYCGQQTFLSNRQILSEVQRHVMPFDA